MDERGYLLEALLERLEDEGVEWCRLIDGFAVPSRMLRDIPRRLARFCQELDLQLVQLYAPGRAAWRCVLCWYDDVGRPSFLALHIVGDDGLAGGRPDLLFSHALREAVERLQVDDERADWLAQLWQADPRGAIEQIRRRWRQPRDFRLLAQAAKHGDWRAVRAQLPRLRRAARPLIATRLARADAWLRRALDFSASRAEPSPRMAPAALKALECRVERRFPEALVGRNGFWAKALQRRWLRPVVQPLLNCVIECPLPSPVLMPYPFGIVIAGATRIGSRVTVMHQATIFDAIVEDNVTIGPGAKIIGPLRIGRGARIGANAVVTADVPSHSVEPVVAARRRESGDVVNKQNASVVNM